MDILDPNWELTVKWDMHGHQMLLKHSDLMTSFPAGKFFLEIGSDRGEGSTKALAELANKLQLIFITVDMNPDIQKKALKIVQEVNPKFSAECYKGEDFINFFKKDDIAILYLDAYDTMPPGLDLPQDIKDPYIKSDGKWNNEAAWEMHLKASMRADKRLIPGGLICFDDEWRKEGVWAKRSKGYTAIPWLLEQGYDELLYVDGCILLRKPT